MILCVNTMNEWAAHDKRNFHTLWKSNFPRHSNWAQNISVKTCSSFLCLKIVQIHRMEKQKPTQNPLKGIRYSSMSLGLRLIISVELVKHCSDLYNGNALRGLMNSSVVRLQKMTPSMSQMISTETNNVWIHCMMWKTIRVPEKAPLLWLWNS